MFFDIFSCFFDEIEIYSIVPVFMAREFAIDNLKRFFSDIIRVGGGVIK